MGPWIHCNQVTFFCAAHVTKRHSTSSVRPGNDRPLVQLNSRFQPRNGYFFIGRPNPQQFSQALLLDSWCPITGIGKSAECHADVGPVALVQLCGERFCVGAQSHIHCTFLNAKSSEDTDICGRHFVNLVADLFEVGAGRRGHRRQLMPNVGLSTARRNWGTLKRENVSLSDDLQVLREVVER